ncbi:ATP-binding protein [Gracilibacillus boraciitolerans]|uniref:ATP-binding protein n=1 Tax=Gracilibacillus boraciitolerans TaxID=307521 RepID=UPI0034E2ACCB
MRDEGAGITAQDLPYVFDRYYTNSKRQGSGLGLAISKEIITMHNGNIWVDSQIDQGTTFNFSIPLVSHSLETRGRFACFTRR